MSDSILWRVSNLSPSLRTDLKACSDRLLPKAPSPSEDPLKAELRAKWVVIIPEVPAWEIPGPCRKDPLGTFRSWSRAVTGQDDLCGKPISSPSMQVLFSSTDLSGVKLYSQYTIHDESLAIKFCTQITVLPTGLLCLQEKNISQSPRLARRGLGRMQTPFHINLGSI